MSARLRLTLSYALFLLAAGGATLLGVYVVLRYVPNYPLTAANPSEAGTAVASRQEILDAIVRMSGAVLGGLALVGLGGGWLLAGWILRPLDAINAATRIAATGRLNHRVALTGRHDEFRELADSVDHMLERLHDAFLTQERFAANASHELRTPLAITSAMLEVARSDPDGQNIPRLLKRLEQTNDRAIALTEALLRLADANAVTAQIAPVDLARVTNDVVATCRPEANARGIRIETDVTAAPTVGDPDLLAQLVTNLVQNAIRHNLADGGLSVRLHPVANSVVLRVENNGPVLDPTEVDRLTEPFLRGAGRTTCNERVPGHGLGLAIVERIVTVHGGTLTLQARPEGGLRATVRLPVGGDPQATVPNPTTTSPSKSIAA